MAGDQLVARYQIIGHHLPELFTEHLRCDTGYRPTKLPKPPRPFEKPLEHHGLPASFNHGYRRVERASCALRIRILSSQHFWPPGRSGYFKVPACFGDKSSAKIVKTEVRCRDPTVQSDSSSRGYRASRAVLWRAA